MNRLNKWWQAPQNQATFILLVSAALIGLYLSMAASFEHLGFPLDDAWIHQTYARNFAQNGRWEFVPGVVSGGSTAPLWTFLLAFGYLINVPYLWWAYALGLGALIMVGVSSLALCRLLWPEKSAVAVWAALAVISSWPLIWAAASGMETLLFVGLGMLILLLLLRHLQRPFQWISLIGMGILSGLLILIRPDGLVLILLIFAALAFQSRLRLPQLAGLLLAIMAVVVPYFLFNWRISGTIWPNTFYAKQTEYAALLQIPLLTRFLDLLYFSLGGTTSGWRGISAAHWLLIPGVIMGGWTAVQRDWQAKRLFFTLPLLWAGGHIALYAWRLPLTFQHGRYLMAALPIWVIYGVVGWTLLEQRVQLSARLTWLFKQTAIFTYATIAFYFLILGSQSYAQDVAFIENEMVKMSKWVAEHTPEDAVLAAHDIGALGFFAERPLVDLAGLITPEIIPLLDQENQVLAYVWQSEADYLITAPGWAYSDITKNELATELFSTNYAFTRQNGLNNMTIYLLKPR